MDHRHLHEENRRSWNAATDAHNRHKADQAAFLREGGSSLFPEELGLLGPLDGVSLAHLQCNSGQDTLSLASLGAVVTGVDISDRAIGFARDLSAASRISAEFVRADVYDWLAEVDSESYDVVFCSYGALCWLSDLAEWAKGTAKVLRTGGRLVCVEFHPFSMVFDEAFQVTYPYFAEGEALTWEDGVGDYVGAAGPALAPSGFIAGKEEFRNPHPVHEFQWGIAEVLQSLISAGMVIERVEEYPYSNGAKLFDDLVETAGRRFVRPHGKSNLPLMWGFVARRV